MFHWPTPQYYIDAWNKLCSLYIDDKKSGVIKSIGICNMKFRYLNEMQGRVDILPHISHL
jgi:diketogulonate reductase-like aldo/keto reductase